MNTRRKNLQLFDEPCLKSQIQRRPIRLRGAKLCNKLKVIGIILSRLDKESNNEISEFGRGIKSYLLGNDELTKFIFNYKNDNSF